MSLPYNSLLSAVAGGGGGSSAFSIRNASKITSGLTAIKNSGTTRCSPVWVGHSIVSGFGSDNTGGTAASNVSSWRLNSIPIKVSQALSASLGGTAVAGAESFAVFHAGLFTLGGGATLAGPFTNLGVAGMMALLDSPTQSCTFTATGTAVRIYGMSSTVGLQARYQINGGSVQTAPAVTSNPTGYLTTNWYSFDITGLTGGDTITLLGASANTWRVYAVDINLVTTPGMTIHRMSYPGFMGAQTHAAFLDNTDTQPAGSWVSDVNKTTLRISQQHSITTRISNPPLVLCMFDVNDMRAWGAPSSPWSWPLSLHVTHLQNFLAWQASLGVPVLIVCGTLRDPALAVSQGNPYTQADMIDAYRAVSDASTNAAFYDLTAQYTGATLNDRYAAQQATGFIFDDNHPNTSGCAFYGGQIASAILAALP